MYAFNGLKTESSNRSGSTCITFRGEWFIRQSFKQLNVAFFFILEFYDDSDSKFEVNILFTESVSNQHKTKIEANIKFYC